MRHIGRTLLALMLVAVLLPIPSFAAAPPRTQSYDVGQPSADGTAHITGRIMDFRWGTRLSGITVTAYYADGSGSLVASGTATSDQYGNYDIGGLAGGTYTVTTHDPAGNYIDQTASTYVYPAHVVYGAVNFDHALGSGHLKGRVVSSAGQPLPGLWVTAYQLWDGKYGNYFTTATAGDGSFDLAYLPSGSYEIGVQDSSKTYFDKVLESAPGASTPCTIALAAGETKDSYEVTMTLSGHIRGRVVTDKGVPLSGIHVWSYKWDEASSKWATSWSTYSASDGTYDIKPLTPGVYRVMFQGDADHFGGYWPGQVDASNAGTISVALSQDVAGIDATLATAATIGGKVTDGVTGAHLSFVDVKLWRSDATTWTAVDDGMSYGADGSYVFQGLHAGTYRVQFLPGWASSGGTSDTYLGSWLGGPTLDTASDIVVGDGEQSLANDWAVYQVGHIGGTITSGMSGRPVGGVAVTVFERQADSSWAATAVATTNVNTGAWQIDGAFDGTYRVTYHDAQGRYYDASYLSGQDLSTADDLAIAKGTARLGLARALPAVEGTISGTIRGTNGEPVAGAVLSLYQVPYLNRSSLDTLVATTTADADGHYSFSGLEAFSYAIDISDPSGEHLGWSCGAWWDKVGLSPGEDRTWDKTLDTKAVVRGSVVDSDTGAPLANMLVTLYDGPSGNGISSASTDASGSFVFRRLQPSPWGYFRVGVSDPSGRRPVTYSPAASSYWDGTLLHPDPGTTATADIRMPWHAIAAERVAGDDRYITAVEISKRTFTKSDWVVLATGADYPDALAGGPLATALHAPLLLVTRDALPGAVFVELRRLGAKHAIVLGSDRAVGPGVISALADTRLTIPAADVERLGGVDRYDTARLVARRLKAAGGATSGLAFVATGAGYADAVAGACVASAQRVPLLLARGDRIPDPTAQAIQELGISKSVVLGSAATISTATALQLPSPERLGGATRFETAALVSRWAIAHGVTVRQAIVTDAYSFPDALVAAPMGGLNGGVLYPVSTTVPQPTADALAADGPGLGQLLVLGNRTPVGLESVLAGMANAR